ncbi:putative lipoprotein [Leptospira ryugenii]|uniref:Putative lipoprotein n=1 Tax=Leptospira ryugenii TaxID=1917863 RepID=A0A2P2E0T3_9LEPT|nr:putative lipoprotein [Leptospira ryugenii]
MGQPLPQTLTFSAEGVANRKCFLFTRANDAVRNTKENPLVISLGKVVQKNAGGSVVSGFYTDKDPCDISVIQDDDEGPGIRVSNISQVMEEPGSSVQAENRGTFRVVLRTAPTANVTIPMSETADSVNSGNREGTMAPTSLTFTTGNWNIEQVVTVTSVDDQEIDGLKTYIVRTQSTSSSDSEYNGIDPRDVVIYNKDKSVPGYAFEKWDATTQTFTSTGGSSTGYATDEANQMGTTYSTIKIKLRTKPTANVTLSFSTNCGTKCSIVSPNMTFTTSNWNDYQTLQVQGAADGADGGNQDYNVTLTASSTDTTYNTTVTEPSIVIRSCDNDNTRLIQPCNFSGSPFGTSGSRLSGAEPSATTRIWLIAKASPSSDITVGTTSTDTTEGTVPVSVSVTSSNYNRMMTGGTNQITLTHVDDTLVDGSQNWTVTTATSTGGLSYNPLDIEASTTDNEAYFYVNVSGTTREGTTNAATISVCLGANNADTTVTLNIACTVASDECGTLSASSITFPINSRVADANASNSGCPNDANKQTFTVQGFDDTFADGTQSFTVSLTKAANADGNYSSAPNPTSPSVNNEDNEPAGKAIFVTTSTYNGEMTAQGVVGADNNCNTNKPGYAPSGTYKALLVSDSGGGANNPVNDRKVGTNWVISPGLYYYRCESGANNCRDEGNRLFIADGSGSFNPTTMSTDFSSNGAHEFWTGLTTGMAPATQAATPAGCVTLNYKHNCHGFTYQNCDASPFQDLYGTTWIRNAAGSVTTTDRVCTGSYRLICVQQ